MAPLRSALISVARVPESEGRLTADILGLDHEQWNAACFGDAHEICQPTEHYNVIRQLAHSIDDRIPDDLIRLATSERQKRFDFALLNVEQEILATLGYLKNQGYKLALISNASTAEVRTWLDSPLACFFDNVIISCECGLKKPDPAIYQLALKRLGIKIPARALFVGDGGSNEFIGARSVGLRTVLTKRYLRQHRYEKLIAEQGHCIEQEINCVTNLCGWKGETGSL